MAERADETVAYFRGVFEQLARYTTDDFNTVEVFLNKL